MKKSFDFLKKAGLLLAAVLTAVSVSACAEAGKESTLQPEKNEAENTSSEEESAVLDYLVSIEDEPDTVDFQCTSVHYTIAQNVFDRLVEMEKDDEGGVKILPSLARSWDISQDRRCYTFHLRGDVAFSNGEALTSSDVRYSLERLLSHPDSCNQDIAEMIEGAVDLENGEADSLKGFEILNDLDFSITLTQPFEAFLACLSMPGASIMDEQTTREAGERFGKEPAWTVGTGPFILEKWEPSKGMRLLANKNCWSGKPSCEGLELLFMTESEEARQMFENGELDVLDLDELGDLAEFFIHGDIYQGNLREVQPIGITYIALNESVGPLADKRVRKALQLSLNREALLDAAYSGRGSVENGIFPHGLYGYDPDLPEIPCDPDAAKKLLEEAGYPDGFDLTVSVKSSSTQWELSLMTLASYMWEKVGVRAKIELLDENEFMRLRKSGSLSCYTATWTADYNDPDNFIYTFFGNKANTSFRSLCYPREEIMKRVRDARTIADPGARLKEYRELEKIIVQEDAAWIPLFSRLRYYVVSNRTEGFKASWNGSVKNNYRHMSVGK